jgi:anti-sigma factor RsiW
VDVTCDNLPRVSAYHDGELSEAAAAEVERHMATCAACAAELEGYRAMSRSIESAELPKLSASARRRLRRALEEERSAGRLRIIRALTAVAASVFFVAAAQVIHQQGFEQGSPTNRGAGMPADSVMLSQGPHALAEQGPHLLPASPAPQSSFAQFMVDGLEQGK